jgi:hypothetical protein
MRRNAAQLCYQRGHDDATCLPAKAPPTACALPIVYSFRFLPLVLQTVNCFSFLPQIRYGKAV